MTLIDVFRWCCFRSRKLKVSANARSTLFAMIEMWNGKGRKSPVKITVEEMRGLSMLNERSYRRAVQEINTNNIGFHIKYINGTALAVLFFDVADVVADPGVLSIARTGAEEELKVKKAATRPSSPTSEEETSTSSSPKQSIAGELISLDAKKARSLRQNKYSRSSQCGINFFL